MSEQLLKEILWQLKIDSDSEDAEFIGILVTESESALKAMCGEDIDFELPFEKELLKNRIRYAYNDVLEDFEFNFKFEIERMGVKYAKNSTESV